MATEIVAIVQRLERVDSHNRRLKQAGLAVLLFAGVLLVMASCGPSRTVEAEKFVIRDNQGRVRIELGVTDGNPAVHLMDEKGQVRAV